MRLYIMITSLISEHLSFCLYRIRHLLLTADLRHFHAHSSRQIILHLFAMTFLHLRQSILIIHILYNYHVTHLSSHLMEQNATLINSTYKLRFMCTVYHLLLFFIVFATPLIIWFPTYWRLICLTWIHSYDDFEARNF